MDRFTQTGLGICKSSMLQHNFQKFRAFPFQKFRCFFSDCIAEHSQCGNAVSLCHLCEITGSKTAAVCGSCEQTVKIISLQVTNHAKCFIIHNHDLNRKILSLHPLQFLDIHLECTVSADAGGRFSGCIIRSDSSRKSIAHSAMTAGEKKLLSFMVLK